MEQNKVHRTLMLKDAKSQVEFPLIKAVFINKIGVILRAGSVVSFLARNDYFKGPTI